MTTPPPLATASGHRASSRMPVVVLALGLLSILMLVGTNWIRQRFLNQNLALGRGVREVQTLLATSHLWLEEYVTGDEIDSAELWRSLERTRELLTAMASGGAPWPASPPLRPLAEPELRTTVDRIAAEARQFTRLTRERYDGLDLGQPVGIGSAMDVAFDAVFYSLLRDLQLLEDRVEERLDRDRRRSRLVHATVLAAWGVLIVLAVTGLWSRERHRDRALAALEESREQLLQAQKMDAVGRLAGGLAHDINNYLAAITAQCELVQMRADRQGRTWQKMEQVMATAGKAAALIQQLLAFSRREPLQPRVVDLNQLVSGMEGMLERLLGEDVRLRTELAGDLWPVRMDPSQFEQVLLNLAVNARDAMKTGGTLTIRTANRPGAQTDGSGDDWVRVTVQDDGPGIPPEVRERLFEPFVTTKAESGHSGLGLSTVYGILNRHGGRVEVESGRGQGAVFELWLPRSEGETFAGEGTGAPRPERHPRGRRVLLVEDSDELRSSTGEALSELGYEVLAAAGGEEAVRLFEAAEEKPEIVVTDVVMPGMNGRQVIDALQRLRPGLPALFVSGYTDDVMLRHGVDEEEAAFLQKPYSVAQLHERIQEVLPG